MRKASPHGARRSATDDFAAALGREQMLQLDDLLVRVKNRICQAALACLRGKLDAYRQVRAVLLEVDSARGALRAVEIEDG